MTSHIITVVHIGLVAWVFRYIAEAIFYFPGKEYLECLINILRKLELENPEITHLNICKHPVIQSTKYLLLEICSQLSKNV